MDFEPMNFIYNLKYILMGELGTFTVLTILMLSILILNKVYENRK